MSSVEVTLLEEGKTLDRKTISLEPGTREYDVPLSFTADREGTRKMAVEVSHLPGEISYQNNRSTFFVKVLKSKMQVVLVAGAPSPDVSAIRRALQEDRNVDLKTFIGRGSGQFYEGLITDQVLRDADCVILVGYPKAGDPATALAAIARAADAGKGLFFVPSRSLDFQKLKSLEPFLPFIVPPQGERKGNCSLHCPKTNRITRFCDRRVRTSGASCHPCLPSKSPCAPKLSRKYLPVPGFRT